MPSKSTGILGIMFRLMIFSGYVLPPEDHRLDWETLDCYSSADGGHDFPAPVFEFGQLKKLAQVTLIYNVVMQRRVVMTKY